MHPDDVIAIAACENSQALTREIFGDRRLAAVKRRVRTGAVVGALVTENPDAGGPCWRATACSPGATRQGLLRDHPGVINQATAWLNEKNLRRSRIRRRTDGPAERRVAARLMPEIRGIGKPERKIERFDDEGWNSSARPTWASGRLFKLPRPPAHQDPPAGGGFRSGRPGPGGLDATLEAYRATMAPITTAAAGRQPGDARSQPYVYLVPGVPAC